MYFVDATTNDLLIVLQFVFFLLVYLFNFSLCDHEWGMRNVHIRVYRCICMSMPVFLKHSNSSFETGPLTECRVRLEGSKAQNMLSEAHPLHMALQDYMDYMFGHVWLFMWVLASNIRSSHSCCKHSYSVSHVTSSTFRFQWFVMWLYGARKEGILVFSFLWS